MTGFPPTYNAGSSLFLIASWAPLISKVDFPNERVADRILPNVKHDLRDRHSRPVNRFWRDGLVEVIMDAENRNYYLAQKLAGQVAKRAGLRDPLGVVRLAWGTYTDFWNSTMMTPRLRGEQGELELPDPVIKYFKEHYDEDLSGSHVKSDAYEKRYHQLGPGTGIGSCCYRRSCPSSRSSSPVPIGAAYFHRSRRLRDCSQFPLRWSLSRSLRYLHPVAWLTFLQIGQILSCRARAVAAPGARHCRQLVKRATVLETGRYRLTSK